MSKVELCKCCGGEAKVYHTGTILGERYRVRCIRCGTTSDIFPSSDLAVKAWNRKYSGINDKNGKPICHGDYIRISGIQWADEIPGMYRVKYSVNEFTWYLVRVYEYEHLGIGLYSFADLNLSMFTDEIELVDIKTVNDCIKEKGVDIHGEER